MTTSPSPRILLVDDIDANRYAMSRMLRKEGFLVIEATTGREALQLAAAQPQPDLVVLDVRLPDLSGFEICAQLKEHPATVAIPVLQLSAVYVRDEDKVQGLQSGADTYLTGPVEPSVLLATVQSLLRVRQMDATLREREERLRLALEAAQMGTWDWDLRTGVVTWSTNLEAAAGLGPGTFGGTYEAFLTLVHPSDRPQADQAISRALVEGTLHDLEYRFVRPDGATRWVVSKGQVFTDMAGQAVRMVGVTMDITARKETEAELQRVNAELQQFARIVSHDLCEPLRTVANFVTLLAKRFQGSLDADAEEYIAFAVDGAQRMQQMIQDLLLYSRVGDQARMFTAVDCEAVLTNVVNDLQLVITESGATVTHDPLPTVRGDATRLGQVLQNLIGNALKFHGAAPPQIHVSARRGSGHWQFAVRDNGVGLDPRHAERIFQVFQRLHPRSEYPGTGIGLAICKKIVEQHGGRIWVESQPGAGSTFYFTISDI
jgi:PAS domain S-box-containing protein